MGNKSSRIITDRYNTAIHILDNRVYEVYFPDGDNRVSRSEKEMIGKYPIEYSLMEIRLEEQFQYADYFGVDVVMDYHYDLIDKVLKQIQMREKCRCCKYTVLCTVANRKTAKAQGKLDVVAYVWKGTAIGSKPKKIF